MLDLLRRSLAFLFFFPGEASRVKLHAGMWEFNSPSRGRHAKMWREFHHPVNFCRLEFPRSCFVTRNYHTRTLPVQTIQLRRTVLSPRKYLHLPSAIDIHVRVCLYSATGVVNRLDWIMPHKLALVKISWR